MYRLCFSVVAALVATPFGSAWADGSAGPIVAVSGNSRVAVVASPHGVAGDSTLVRVHAIDRDMSAREFVLDGAHVTAASLYPNGDWLIAGLSDGSIMVMDSEAGNVDRSWRAHDGAVVALHSDVSFLRTSRRNWLTTVGADGRVCTWPAHRHRLVGDLQLEPSPQQAAFSVDGLMVILSARGDLVALDATTIPTVMDLTESSGPWLEVAAATMVPWLAARHTDGTVRVWRGIGLEPTTIGNHRWEDLRGIAAYSSGQELLLQRRDNTVISVNAEAGIEVDRWRPDLKVLRMTSAPNSRAMLFFDASGPQLIGPRVEQSLQSGTISGVEILYF